jgi:hypothetical protein
MTSLRTGHRPVLARGGTSLRTGHRPVLARGGTSLRTGHRPVLARGGERRGSEQELIAGAMERLDLALETAEAEGTPAIEVAERQALERVELARAR